MRRRPAPSTGGAAVDAVAAHQMVRELEKSIAARLAAANSSHDDLTQARAEADALIAEAESQAAQAGRVHAAAILSAARAEAAHLEADGEREAAELTATATRRRDDDVAAILAEVLRTAEVN